jgi:uncharacterized protein
MTNQSDIIKTLQHNKTKIQEFGVVNLCLFGSYAKGVHRPESDIDLLVEFKEGRGLFEDFYGLLHFLESILGKKIDLVERSLIREELKKEILGGVLVDAQV